jgi:hypothetical protein
LCVSETLISCESDNFQCHRDLFFFRGTVARSTQRDKETHARREQQAIQSAARRDNRARERCNCARGSVGKQPHRAQEAQLMPRAHLFKPLQELLQIASGILISTQVAFNSTRCQFKVALSCGFFKISRFICISWYFYGRRILSVELQCYIISYWKVVGLHTFDAISKNGSLSILFFSFILR